MNAYVEGDPRTGDVVASAHANGSNDKSVQIKRGKFDSISLYEVTEEELNILEMGENSLELNFAIALGSVVVTIIVALCTTTMTDLIKGIFVVCAVLFAVLALYFIWKWKKNKGNVQRTFEKIKSRLKE